MWNGNNYSEGGAASGGVYLFSNAVGDWAVEGYFVPSPGDVSDRFVNIAFHAGTIAVGAPGKDRHATAPNGNSLPNSGALYVSQ